MIILYIILVSSTLFGQLKPYKEPNFIKETNPYTHFNQFLNDSIMKLESTNKTTYHHIQLPYKQLYTVQLIPNTNINKFEYYLIDLKTLAFNGPYTNTDLISDPIYTKDLIIEISCIEDCKKSIDITISEFKFLSVDKTYNNNPYIERDNSTILVTGYWPPTNEMIRHFSQDNLLNPNGWQGENWENSGYNIISYFPTFDDPDCSSCGQGNGILQVDYQNTSNDFWPIAESLDPIAIITFSRGFNNLSWELEYNAYNRTNWYNDYEAPFLPTPNPPDENAEINFLRNSNLPMDNIIDNINNLNIGLNPYIDVNGDPGQFVSEFMAYHGTWYRDLNTDKCIAAGHVHVGGQISVETARLAANETIRSLIQYLNENTYIAGDSNLDNIIDVLDLVQIINHILGSIELINIEFLASDINQDNSINIQDVILVVNMILNN